MLFLHRSALPALCLSLLFTSVLPVQAEDAPSPAVEKPAERQALPERSQQEASALERQVPNAYERVLMDALRGDQTLFTSTEEVKAEWKFITPILEKWSTLPLHAYQKGSSGPNM